MRITPCYWVSSSTELNDFLPLAFAYPCCCLVESQASFWRICGHWIQKCYDVLLGGFLGHGFERLLYVHWPYAVVRLGVWSPPNILGFTICGGPAPASFYVQQNCDGPLRHPRLSLIERWPVPFYILIEYSEASTIFWTPAMTFCNKVMRESRELNF